MHKLTTPLIVAAAALTAHGEFARQFRAKDIRGDGSWPSFNGKSQMSPVHAANSNGWIRAVVNTSPKPHGLVSFATTPQGTPSPFEFACEATQLVSHAFIIVCADSELTALSTLISAPLVPLRLKTDADPVFGAVRASREFATEFRGENSAVEVDGASPPLLSSGIAYRLIHCRWETPQETGRIFLGNSSASPRWGRSWKGSGIAEVILTGDLDDAEVNAINRYISSVYNIRGISYPDGDIPSIMRRLGLDGSWFPTMVIIK